MRDLFHGLNKGIVHYAPKIILVSCLVGPQNYDAFLWRVAEVVVERHALNVCADSYSVLIKQCFAAKKLETLKLAAFKRRFAVLNGRNASSFISRGWGVPGNESKASHRRQRQCAQRYNNDAESLHEI